MIEWSGIVTATGPLIDARPPSSKRVFVALGKAHDDGTTPGLEAVTHHTDATGILLN